MKEVFVIKTISTDSLSMDDSIHYDRKYSLSRNVRTLIFDALRRNYENRNYQHDFNVSECKCKLLM